MRIRRLRTVRLPSLPFCKCLRRFVTVGCQPLFGCWCVALPKSASRPSCMFAPWCARAGRTSRRAGGSGPSPHRTLTAALGRKLPIIASDAVGQFVSGANGRRTARRKRVGAAGVSDDAETLTVYAAAQNPVEQPDREPPVILCAFIARDWRSGVMNQTRPGLRRGV